MGWQDLTVVKEIRHNERLREAFDYQSVVIVRSNHVGGVENLRGSDFCHPGLHYERHQRWSEKFLKHFERSIIKPNCSFDGKSPVEVEVSAMSNFFNAACRPGAWSLLDKEDKMLKEKYFKLCALCDDPLSCSYEDSSSLSSHRQALECMKKSGNAVTYVALQEAQQFFNENSNIASDFSLLCPNGSLQVITSNTRPCVWLSQPWKLIITNTDKAISLATNLNRWLSMPGSGTGWESSLRQILVSDTSSVVAVSNIVRLPDFIAPIRPIPIGIDVRYKTSRRELKVNLISFQVCANGIKWCTHSYDEKEKCEVLRMAALTTGIVPNIICNNAKSDTVSCLSDVATGKADFVGIDSNFGYIARK
jgi:Transferrin